MDLFSGTLNHISLTPDVIHTEPSISEPRLIERCSFARDMFLPSSALSLFLMYGKIVGRIDLSDASSARVNDDHKNTFTPVRAVPARQGLGSPPRLDRQGSTFRDQPVGNIVFSTSSLQRVRILAAPVYNRLSPDRGRVVYRQGFKPFSHGGEVIAPSPSRLISIKTPPFVGGVTS